MALIVQKYGGTSVGTIEKIGNVADKVAARVKSGDQVVVAVSAMSGETNRLVALSQAVSSNPHPREMDVLLSTGEQVTIALLALALQEQSLDARSYLGSQVKILTDDAHAKARIKELSMNAGLQDRVIQVMTKEIVSSVLCLR